MGNMRDSGPVQVISVIVVWAIVVSCGFAYLLNYSATAGTGNQGPLEWPAEAGIARHDGQATLVIFMHPACPCSRATVHELSRLLARAGTPIDVVAAFIRPEGFAKGWERTDLWNSAAQIPNVRCVVDEGGKDARRFGAATSGFSLLYDVDGALMFQGGISAARGHEGDNAGEDAILSWSHGGAAYPSQTPVFGCALLDE